MSITTKWIIMSLECKPAEGDLTNVVQTVHWTVNGTDGTYAGSAYGAVGVPVADPVTFTPYESLTEDEIVGWVKTVLGEETVTAYEANVANQITAQVTPPIVKPPLPWAPIITYTPEE